LALSIFMCGFIFRFGKPWLMWIFLFFSAVSIGIWIRKMPAYLLPMETNPVKNILHPAPSFLPVIGWVAVLAVFFLWMERRFPKSFLGMIAVLLIPLCFLYTTPLSFFDYNYVFAPAVRLLDGIPISQIYFQYDLLLSVIAAFLLKCGGGFAALGVFAQFSYYGLLFFLFLFAKKLYLNKSLSVLLLLALVIVKIYANLADPIQIIQVTPARLDLWILLLWIAYQRGLFSKLLSVTLGVLYICAASFGIIYFIAYILLLCTVFLTDVIRDVQESKPVGPLLRTTLVKYGRILLPHLGIWLLAFFIHLLMFQRIVPEAATIYSEVGVGFLPIVRTSFYWFLVPVFLISFVLLHVMRKVLADRYFGAGLFLIFLSLGSLMYFYGRSHENNLLNIGACLLVLFFLMIDLLQKYLSMGNGNRQLQPYLWMLRMIPVAAVVYMAGCYSNAIEEKFAIQAGKLFALRELPIQFDNCSSTNTAMIQENTNHSDKVYFASLFCDSAYYFNGNYVPISYFSPFSTWMVKKDLNDYLRSLLDKGYYIVFDNLKIRQELLPVGADVRVEEEQGLTFVRVAP
jgi:hypothetical protein